MSETRQTRIKRLYMRSIRRGIKEMDIILTRFADAELDRLDEDLLDLYDALLHENDQDLYRWVTNQENAPERFGPIMSRIQQGISN